MPTGASCSKRSAARFDIACVGTPDHMHAPIAMSAMRLGIPVYVQKPLAHNIHEIRHLTECARKKKLVTQMGIQIHSRTEYQTAVALVQSGAIGKIKEVHSWSEKEVGRPGRDARPQGRGAAQLRLGPVARRGAIAAVPGRRLLPPRQLAQAHRLRHRHLRRHGLPHHRSGLRCARPDRAGLGTLRRACAHPA